MNRILYLVILLGINSIAYTQWIEPNLLSTAGDYFETGNYSFSWSLGEIATETLNGENIILTQGFQQSNLIRVGIKEHQNSNKLTLILYPNPTQGTIYIIINAEAGSDEFPNRYELYDTQGKILETNKISTKEISVKLEKYENALYYLRLSNSDSKYHYTAIIQKLN